MKPNKLFDQSTHFVPKWCTIRRPCYRDFTCKYCWSRRRSFVLKQADYWGPRWNFSKFVTITLTGHKGTITDGFRSLATLRRQLHKQAFAESKYLSFAIVARQRLTNSDGSYRAEFTPNWHLLSDDTVSAMRIRSTLARQAPSQKIDVNITPLRYGRGNLRRVCGYLMDQNFKKALPYKPSGMRLITASRGMYTGRPRDLNHLTWTSND